MNRSFGRNKKSKNLRLKVHEGLYIAAASSHLIGLSHHLHSIEAHPQKVDELLLYLGIAAFPFGREHGEVSGDLVGLRRFAAGFDQVRTLVVSIASEGRAGQGRCTGRPDHGRRCWSGSADRLERHRGRPCQESPDRVGGRLQMISKRDSLESERINATFSSEVN